jgi:ankyrin repeat protein
MENSCPLQQQQQSLLTDSLLNVVDELKFNLFDAVQKDDAITLFNLLMNPNHSRIATEIILNDKDKRGYYIFHVAAIMGSLEPAKLLFAHIKQFPPMVSAHVQEQLPLRCASVTDSDNFTPIHYICSENHEELLQVFIQECSYYDINKALQTTSSDTTAYVARSIPLYVPGGRTPMHYCAEKGSIECAKIVFSYLQQRGDDNTLAQMFAPDFDGNTPLDLALLANLDEEFCQMLFDTQKRFNINSNTPQEGEKVKLLSQDERSEKAKSDHKVRMQRMNLTNSLDEKKIREDIISKYQRLHEDLFAPQFDKKFVMDSYLKALESGTLSNIVKQECPGVYSFEILTPEFCQKLVEEMVHYEQSGLPVRRPNSMNNYGLVLNSMGLEDMCSDIMKQLIEPLSSELYGESGFRAHHSFIVKYKIGEDLDLDTHIDSSDITLNICLGKQFEGGSVFFKGVKGTESEYREYTEWQPRPGKAILHFGKHIHGANKITSGERVNLIIWCRKRRRQ